MSSHLDFEQVLPNVHDEANQALQVSSVVGVLVPKKFDAIAVSYYSSGSGAGQIQTVQYYVGGLSGTLVSTLTLTYSGSGQLAGVART